MTDMDWQLAACRGEDPELFYPDAGPFSTAGRAKGICGRCQLKDECLQHAIDNMEAHGIWGGMTASERQAEIRKRRFDSGTLGERTRDAERAQLIPHRLAHGEPPQSVAGHLGLAVRTVQRYRRESVA